jgi:hypothetical protein
MSIDHLHQRAAQLARIFTENSSLLIDAVVNALLLWNAGHAGTPRRNERTTSPSPELLAKRATWFKQRQGNLSLSNFADRLTVDRKTAKKIRDGVPVSDYTLNAIRSKFSDLP